MKIKLFPFHLVPPGSDVVIYGAGQIGEGFIRQLEALSYCNVVGIVDKNYASKQFQYDGLHLLPPDAIKSMKYDYVVVATVQYKCEIVETLQEEYSVDREKIITLDDRYYTEKYITPSIDWTGYYVDAERSAAMQFENYVHPIFEKYGIYNTQLITLDFACGRGRIADKLMGKFGKLFLCDISLDALHYCKNRFKNESHIELIQSKPEGIPLNNQSVGFIYSWDAMVHFNYKMLDIYISEFSRLLSEGDYCCIHHSDLANYKMNNPSTQVSENFNENPNWRANVSKQDVVRIAERNEFVVVEQTNIDWGGHEALDCITVLRKSKR